MGLRGVREVERMGAPGFTEKEARTAQMQWDELLWDFITYHHVGRVTPRDGKLPIRTQVGRVPTAHVAYNLNIWFVYPQYVICTT